MAELLADDEIQLNKFERVQWYADVEIALMTALSKYEFREWCRISTTKNAADEKIMEMGTHRKIIKNTGQSLKS